MEPQQTIQPQATAVKSTVETPPVTPATASFNPTNFITQARAAGQSDDQIMSFLQAKGVNVGTPTVATPETLGQQEGGEVTDIAKNVEDTASGKQGLGQGVLNSVGDIAGGVNDAVGSLVNHIPIIGPLIQKGGKALMDTQTAQDLLQKYNDFSTKHPEAAKDLSDVFNIATALPVAEGIGGGIDAAKDAISSDSTADIAKNSVSSARKAATVIPKQVAGDVTNLFNSGYSPEEIQGMVKGDFESARGNAGNRTIDDPYTNIGNNVGKQHADALSEQFKSAGAAKESALDSFGDKPIDTSSTQDLFKQQMEDKLGATVDPLVGRAEGKSFEENIAGLNKSIDESVTSGDKGPFGEASGKTSLIKSSGADQKLLANVQATLSDIADGKNSAREIDGYVDKLQNEVSYKNGALPASSQTESVVKSVIKELNDKVKAAGTPEYTAANDQFTKLYPSRDFLNKKLGPIIPETGKYANAAEYAKSAVGSDDSDIANIKAIENQTGIPLQSRAGIADFAAKSMNVPGAAQIGRDAAVSAVSHFGRMRLVGDLINAVQDPEGKLLANIAKESGIKEPVSNLTKLLSSDDDVQKSLKKGGLNAKQATALLLLSSIEQDNKK